MIKGRSISLVGPRLAKRLVRGRQALRFPFAWCLCGWNRPPPFGDLTDFYIAGGNLRGMLESMWETL